MKDLKEEILDRFLNGYPWQHWSKENAMKAMEEYATEMRKKGWKNVKDELPAPGKKVLKYNSEMNSSQSTMAVTISDSGMLKHSDETVWWMDIPELPVPTKIL
jgi:hypothetical protein